MKSEGPGRLRRFLLLELPGWAIVAVSVAYSSSSSSGWVTVFFQLVLISGALAWLFGGRLESLHLGSFLFGWAAGTVATFNLLTLASIGIFLIPVTIYVVVVLVLLLSARNSRCAVTAAGGVVLAVATQIVFIGFFAQH